MAISVAKDRAAVVRVVIPDGGVNTAFDRASVADIYYPGGSSGGGTVPALDTVMDLGGIAVLETVALTAEATQTIQVNSDVWGSP